MLIILVFPFIVGCFASLKTAVIVKTFIKWLTLIAYFLYLKFSRYLKKTARIHRYTTLIISINFLTL